MIGPRGRELVKQAEGLRLTAYQCPAGKWTIGYGHTHLVKEGDTCTEADAEAYLAEDLVASDSTISYLVTAPLTESMRDALGSFVFNLGHSKLRISTLLRKLNAKHYEAVPAEFRRWTWGRVDGQMVELPGLIARREAEAKLFLEDGLPS